MGPDGRPIPDDAVLAAGGVLYRRTAQGPRVAVAHRPRYDDWSLPKGKVDPGESLEEAALREVHEEVGCRATLGTPAGRVSYEHDGATKVVLFWHMRCEDGCVFAPNDEVDEVRWLSVPEAVAQLSYDRDRVLLSSVSGH